jgi:hypothetical protein
VIEFILGKLSTGSSLTQKEYVTLADYIYDLENLLDQGDNENFYGTEGWRHRLGLD